jgi:hypothetical protein
MVSNDASGITAQGIQAACQILEVLDPKECYVKVMELAKKIRILTEPVKPINGD